MNPAAGQSRFVEVLDTEEKGTEVNLATELLVDSFKSNYEQAVIVSSDADFATAMRYVKNDLGLRMTFVNPDRTSSPPRDLSAAATYVKNLRSSHLRASQLPLALFDAKGSITKPDAW